MQPPFHSLCIYLPGTYFATHTHYHQGLESDWSDWVYQEPTTENTATVATPYFFSLAPREVGKCCYIYFCILRQRNEGFWIIPCGRVISFSMESEGFGFIISLETVYLKRHKQ